MVSDPSPRSVYSRLLHALDRPVTGILLVALVLLFGAALGAVAERTLATRPEGSATPTTAAPRKAVTTTVTTAAAPLERTSCVDALRAVADAVDLLGQGVAAAKDLDRAALERVTNDLQRVREDMRRTLDRCGSAGP